MTDLLQRAIAKLSELPPEKQNVLAAMVLEELELDPRVGALDVLKAAQAKQWDIVTAEAEMAALAFDAKLPFGRTIVFLQLEGGDVEQDDAIDRLFERYKRLAAKRLYTITPTRVKIRQLPGAG